MMDKLIEKFVLKHGDKYNYDKVNYINANAKILIVCKIHGDFQQISRNHMNGSGCPECGRNKKLTTNSFIEKSLEIYGDKYSYDKVNYINANTKIILTCKVHGDFSQFPRNHLKGMKCSKCTGNKKYTTEEFIEKSNIVHNNLYEYNNVEFINSKIKVCITCKIHGDFYQIPTEHISGKGCASCSKSKGELKIENYLKENNINFKPQYSFPNLKYIKILKFDFGILDDNDNLKYLIEFNGIQHYNFDNFFHKTEDEFKLSEYKDKLKMDYCIKNNIPLQIIKYDENISNKMNNIFEKF